MVLFLGALMGYVAEKSDSLASTTLYNRVWCSITYKDWLVPWAGMCCGGRGVALGWLLLGNQNCSRNNNWTSRLISQCGVCAGKCFSID